MKLYASCFGLIALTILTSDVVTGLYVAVTTDYEKLTELNVNCGK